MKNNARLFVLALVLLTIVISLLSCSHTHTEEIIQAVPATCTENGYTEGTRCAECEEVLVAPQTIEKKGHTEVIIQAVPATCTENGYTEGTKCSICNEVFVEPQVVLASHKTIIIPAVSPQVGKTGNTRGEKCTVCHEFLIEPQEITLLEIEIDEKKSQSGKVFGSLVITEVESELSLYYADEKKEKLPYYDEIAKIDKGEAHNLDGLIIPSGCEYIIATDGGDYDYFVAVPEAYQLSSKEYTFSALSDAHYNKGEYFGGALDFLDDYGIDFVGVSGDLSDSGEVNLFEKFNEAIKDRLYKVYTTTGNHDTPAVKSGNWEKYINTSITTDSEVKNISANGIDFVFVPQKAQDNVFVFLCQTYWAYSKQPSSDAYMLITEEQIAWLTDVLEEYKDKNVFLFFHTFLSAPDGTQESAVGNLRNPGGYAYDLPFSYGSADEVAFRALMKKYKNVVFFSGHSHWMFDMEIYNENLNYSNFDGEYCHMVHVPSVCEPRCIGENDTRRTSKTGKASEGWIVEVHDEAIVLIPVDFLAEVFYTEYMKIIPLN